MEKHETPWNQGLFLICQKCGTAVEKPALHEELRVDLRNYLRGRELGQEIRVISSGCLSICDKQKQTVAYAPKEGSTEVVSFEFENLNNELKKYLDSKLES